MSCHCDPHSLRVKATLCTCRTHGSFLRLVLPQSSLIPPAQLCPRSAQADEGHRASAPALSPAPGTGPAQPACLIIEQGLLHGEAIQSTLLETAASTHPPAPSRSPPQARLATVTHTGCSPGFTYLLCSFVPVESVDTELFVYSQLQPQVLQQGLAHTQLC